MGVMAIAEEVGNVLLEIRDHHEPLPFHHVRSHLHLLHQWFAAPITNVNNITKSNRKTKQLKHFNKCIKDRSKFEVGQVRKRWRECVSGVRVSYHLGAKPRPIRLPSILLSSSIASEPVKCAVSGVEWARRERGKSMPFLTTATLTRQASDFFAFVFFFDKIPLI